MNDNDQWAPHKDSIFRAAKAVLANYDEFGVEGGLDEYMEGLRTTLENVEDNYPAKESRPPGYHPEPRVCDICGERHGPHGGVCEPG